MSGFAFLMVDVYQLKMKEDECTSIKAIYITKSRKTKTVSLKTANKEHEASKILSCPKFFAENWGELTVVGNSERRNNTRNRLITKLFNGKNILFGDEVVVFSKNMDLDMKTLTEMIRDSTGSEKEIKEFSKKEKNNNSVKGLKICLTMIVRDEAHVIERCLNNIKNCVDAIAIVDTGSIDNTVELVENFLRETNISGGICQKPWKGFDLSRNDALLYAYEVVREIEKLPKTGPIMKEEYDRTSGKKWLWFMHDADDGIYDSSCKEFVTENNLSRIIEEYEPNIKKSLENLKLADEYNTWVRIGNCGFYYPRFFRLHLSGYGLQKWHNPVHEVCYTEGIQVVPEYINGFHIYTGKTGGRSKRGNKYLSDLLNLTQGVEMGRITPTNLPRCIFYTAQSCHDLRYYDQAIYYYNQRIAIESGSTYERYISHIRIAQDIPFCRSAFQKELTGDYVEYLRMKNWFSAFTLSNHRREATYELGKYHHNRKEFKIAWFYLKNGLLYDEPQSYDTFADTSMFEGSKYLSMSYLCAWYAGDKDSFVKYGMKLATKEDVPEHVRESAKNNLRNFAKVHI
jgi:glycosyltransferase involved in cell wall biosynthesis